MLILGLTIILWHINTVFLFTFILKVFQKFESVFVVVVASGMQLYISAASSNIEQSKQSKNKSLAHTGTNP